MAVASLAPWPTSPVALADAQTCLREGLGDPLPEDHDPDFGPQPSISVSRLDALGGTAGALVSSYAPGAPVAVRNEAVIRLAGWLRQTPAGDMIVTEVGPLKFDSRATPSRNALRNSGAMGLLAPWRKPRVRSLS